MMRIMIAYFDDFIIASICDWKEMENINSIALSFEICWTICRRSKNFHLRNSFLANFAAKSLNC